MKARGCVTIEGGPQHGLVVPWDDALLFIATPEGAGYVLHLDDAGRYHSVEYDASILGYLTGEDEAA